MHGEENNEILDGKKRGVNLYKFYLKNKILFL